MPAFSHCFLNRFIATSNGSLSRTLITGIRIPPTRQSDSSRGGSSFQGVVDELLWSPDDRLCRIRLADPASELALERGSGALHEAAETIEKSSTSLPLKAALQASAGRSGHQRTQAREGGRTGTPSSSRRGLTSGTVVSPQWKIAAASAA